MITQEDYAVWLVHPITEWVMAAFDAKADEQRKAWNDISWDSGVANDTLLLELRVRADTYRVMKEASYLDLCDALEQEPVIDSR